MATLNAPPGLILNAGYGIDRSTLPLATDVVLSAGGETIAANAATARLLNARNIFCGTLRRLKPEAFSLIVSSYARHAALPRHLVALKPNGIDPDTLSQRGVWNSKRAAAPKLSGLLIGGNSGLFDYTDAEWHLLLAFLQASHRALGIRWVVSTSRRSPDDIGDAVQALATKADGPVAEFIDFRKVGPGTLPRLFGSVEAVLCTEDSSTMISETVCARLPVVGVAPAAHDFKDEEREYRQFIRDQGWARYLPLARLTPTAFLAALNEVVPLAENHLDRLALQLQERLPELFV